jgi:hypothetical protein
MIRYCLHRFDHFPNNDSILNWLLLMLFVNNITTTTTTQTYIREDHLCMYDEDVYVYVRAHVLKSMFLDLDLVFLENDPSFLRLLKHHYYWM